jgi:sulfur relay (sulfurtransferase) DsrC/TusE family protein
MTTVTIELPEPVAQQIQSYGVPQEHLKKAILQFVRLYLGEYQSTTKPAQRVLVSGDEFANRIISNNRALFEELAS